MSIIVDRLKEAEELARTSELATWIYLDQFGVRVTCRFHDGALSVNRIVMWEDIELARINPITRAVQWVQQEVRERMKS